MPMSEDARIKASQRAKATWAKKKAAQAAAEKEMFQRAAQRAENTFSAPDEADHPGAPEYYRQDTRPEPKQPEPSNDEYSDLLKRFEELRSYVQGMQLPQNPMSHNVGGGPQFGHGGRLIGTFEKYLVDPKNYDDPIKRLAAEPRLQRFAFAHNYLLDWNISTTSYETKDGVNTKEPKFTLKLNRIMMDEDTGELTNQAYTVCQMIFHEDPQAALIVAREQGVDPDTLDQKQFLNEMRYLRMRDWLLEAFYPPKSTATQKKKEMVIGNKLVEVFEINSVNPQKMPFDQLKPTKGL